MITKIVNEYKFEQTMINDKKSKQLKLPQIATKTSDSFNEEKPKRPLSSTKVEQLSNKLFNEL